MPPEHHAAQTPNHQQDSRETAPRAEVQPQPPAWGPGGPCHRTWQNEPQPNAAESGASREPAARGSGGRATASGKPNPSPQRTGQRTAEGHRERGGPGGSAPREKSRATPQVPEGHQTAWAAARRMRDLNSRGVAPNTLSKRAP